METESTTMGGRKPPSLPPALYLMHARSRTSKVLDLDSASSGPPTPPLRPPVTVPFLWEEAPGKPKLQETEASTLPPAPAHPLLADGGATAAEGGDHDDGARERPVPLKLPPRLQAAATAEYSLSPNTVLQGPYGGCGGKKPPWPLRRSGSTASCRRKPGAGGSPAPAGGSFPGGRPRQRRGSRKKATITTPRAVRRRRHRRPRRRPRRCPTSVMTTAVEHTDGKLMAARILTTARRGRTTRRGR